MSEPRNVYLYLSETMSDWEPAYALAHVSKPDWQRAPGRYTVRTVAATNAPVRTMAGLTVVPDATVEEVTPDSAAMLMLVGAETWDQPGAHDAVLETARGLLDAGTPVAAICGGTYGLATAGLLDDRAHTSNAPEYLAMSGYGGGELYREERAVTDRGLITTGGTDPVDFAAAIFAQLDLYEPAVLEAWHGLFTTGDPAHIAVLAAA